MSRKNKMESTHRNPQHQSLASTGTYVGKCTCKQMRARTCPPHTHKKKEICMQLASLMSKLVISNKLQKSTRDQQSRDYSLYFVGLEVLVFTEVDTIIILFTWSRQCHLDKFKCTTMVKHSGSSEESTRHWRWQPAILSSGLTSDAATGHLAPIIIQCQYIPHRAVFSIEPWLQL